MTRIKHKKLRQLVAVFNKLRAKAFIYYNDSVFVGNNHMELLLNMIHDPAKAREMLDIMYGYTPEHIGDCAFAVGFMFDDVPVLLTHTCVNVEQDDVTTAIKDQLNVNTVYLNPLDELTNADNNVQQTMMAIKLTRYCYSLVVKDKRLHRDAFYLLESLVYIDGDVIVGGDHGDIIADVIDDEDVADELVDVRYNYYHGQDINGHAFAAGYYAHGCDAVILLSQTVVNINIDKVVDEIKMQLHVDNVYVVNDDHEMANLNLEVA